MTDRQGSSMRTPTNRPEQGADLFFKQPYSMDAALAICAKREPALVDVHLSAHP